MSEERCLLCNKPYDYHYDLFGRGCLENLYELLKISKPPRIIKNKEMYLCNRIALKNFKIFLTKKKKYLLTEKYVALKYLDNIDLNSLFNVKSNNDIFLNEIKNKIKNDIKNITIFSKNNVGLFDFKLNDVYELFNDVQKFKEIIEELKTIDFEKVDEKLAENFIKKLSFIFDLTKKNNPIYYAGYYSMQFAFWEIIVIGGLMAKLRLSSLFLQRSLVINDSKEIENIIITDNEITQLVTDDKEFKNSINELIYNNINDEDNIDVDNYIVEFNDNDLLFAIHKATINLNGSKNNDGTWNLNVEIMDTYDYTEFKDLKEYVTSNKSIPKSIFSVLLNNFAVVSYEYGVIKPYNFTIKFKMNNYDPAKVGESIDN